MWPPVFEGLTSYYFGRREVTELLLTFLLSLSDSADGPGPSLAERLLGPAKAGDKAAREELIRAYTPLVLRVGSQVSGRYLTVGQDEEVSVGLLALNEAIDRFDPARGSAFIPFAELVIKRRMMDYYRRQKSRVEVPLSDLTSEDGEGNPLQGVEMREAIAEHQRQQEAEERREEIARYARRLAEFGICFSDLVAVCPKHADARARAVGIARTVAADPLLSQHLLTRRELPLKQLEDRVGVSRKTLERQRKYIIAVALLLLEDFVHLRHYIAV